MLKDVNELGYDELQDPEIIAEIEASDPEVDETGAPREEPTETQPADIDADQPPEEKPEEKPEEPVNEEPEEALTGEALLEKRLKDTQAFATRAAQEAAELKRKIAKFEAEQRRASIERPEKLTPEQEKELAETDFEAYKDYLEGHRVADEKESELEAELQQARVSITRDNLHAAIKDTFGVEIDVDRPVESWHPDAQGLVKDGKLEALDQYIVNNLRPNEDGVYSRDQISGAVKALFFDELTAVDRTNTRVSVLNDMERAARQSNPMDTVPGESGKATKGLDDLTQEELNALSPEEIQAYASQV
jgi:hypothetical protein